MPSKKQRRRRAKERRHDWEEVYVDAEGNEIPLDELDEDDIDVAAAASGNGSRRPAAAAAPGKALKVGARTIQPPSWTRAFKRALIFAPIMFLVIFWLDSETPYQGKITVGLTYSLLLVPVIYFTDRMVYRSALKRLERERAAKPKPKAR
jgi:hypothetical protein